MPLEQNRVLSDDGFNWIARNGHDDHIAFAKEHEPWLTEWMSAKKGGVFVDVGAHVGRYSVRLARNFDHVYAIEPGFDQRFGLLQNLELNDIKNVIVVPFAAWDETATLPYGHNMQEATQCFASYEVGKGDLVCEGRRLDTIVPWADLMKFDVEGADEHAVRGCEWLIRTAKPEIVVEKHDHVTPGSADAVRDRLRGWGYSWEELPRFGVAQYFHARHKDRLKDA